MLRHLPLCSEYPATVWGEAYHSRKSRIYYGNVHGTCADIRHFFAQKSRDEVLDGSGAGFAWYVFFVYHERGISHIVW